MANVSRLESITKPVDDEITDSVNRMSLPGSQTRFVPKILHSCCPDPQTVVAAIEDPTSLAEGESDVFNRAQDTGEIRIASLSDPSREVGFAPQDMDELESDSRIPGLLPEGGFCICSVSDLMRQKTEQDKLFDFDHSSEEAIAEYLRKEEVRVRALLERRRQKKGK